MPDRKCLAAQILAHRLYVGHHCFIDNVRNYIYFVESVVTCSL